MAVTKVQHVTPAASERLSAKFSDLCDPHDLSSVRASKRTISKLAAKSRASSKAMRQLRSRERRALAATPSSAADEDAFLMSYIPLKTEPALFNVRRSFRIPSGSQSPALAHLAATPRTSHGVTKRLLKLCRGVKSNNSIAKRRGLRVSRAFRHEGYIPLTTYLRNFKLGEYVVMKVNGAIHKDMPHKFCHGRTGIVWNVTKRTVGVVVNKQVGVLLCF